MGRKDRDRSGGVIPPLEILLRLRVQGRDRAADEVVTFAGVADGKGAVVACPLKLSFNFLDWSWAWGGLWGVRERRRGGMRAGGCHFDLWGVVEEWTMFNDVAGWGDWVHRDSLVGRPSVVKEGGKWRRSMRKCGQHTTGLRQIWRPIATSTKIRLERRGSDLE